MEWQPIETAPRNTPVLVFAPKPRSPRVIAEATLGAGQWWARGLGALEPTHWMPLPSPPPSS